MKSQSSVPPTPRNLIARGSDRGRLRNRRGLAGLGLSIILLMPCFAATASFSSPALLGQSRVSRLGSHFSGEKRSRGIAPYVWMTVVPILVAVGASALYQYHQNANVHLDSPGKLFRDLSKAHQLTWDQRRLLQEAAELSDLEVPAVLFVRPDLFDDAARLLTHAKGEKSRARMVALRETLFTATASDQPA